MKGIYRGLWCALVLGLAPAVLLAEPVNINAAGG